MMFRKWNLKKQFITVFLVLITLPTIFFGILIYYQATDAFKEQAEDNTIARLQQNEENLTSIIRSIENMSSYMIYDDSFQTFYTAPEEEVQQVRQAEENIKGYFTFQLMSNTYIDSIYLAGNQGNSLRFGTPLMVEENELTEQAAERQGAPYWSDSYEVVSEWGGSKKVVSLTRIINEINNIRNAIGIVRVRLDESELYQTIEAGSNQQGDYFVLSNTGEVVLHPDSSLVGDPFPEEEVIDLVVNGEELTTAYQTENDTYLLVKKPIEGTDWFSVVSVNEEEVVEGLYNVRSLIRNMIIILIMLGVIAFTGFYLFNIKRIVELTRQTKQLESGDFSARVQVNSQDEIGRLGTRFNHMVVTIQKYIDREYKLKIKQKESELKALQSQIDPHFLYNTLDMIRWTARLENAMETGQLIERLSKVFRMNLSMGKMWVSLEEELTYTQSYLELQKNRMGEQLKFWIFYDFEVRNVYLMKQLIQPLAENSIQHGFKNLPYQGVITIRCYKNNGQLWIDVLDNGWGFPQDNTDSEENPESGYALKNLTDRLEIAFGDQFGLERIDSGKGAWIRLKLPVLEEEDIKLILRESGEQG